MASNDSDTKSIISVQLDNPSNNELVLQQGDVSDSSSTNNVNDLLEDIDSLSDIIEGEPDQNSENGDTPSGLDPDDDDLCVDLDNLANDTRSLDDMYNILNIDPE